jgi:hypothetical protein
VFKGIRSLERVPGSGHSELFSRRRCFAFWRDPDAGLSLRPSAPASLFRACSFALDPNTISDRQESPRGVSFLIALVEIFLVADRGGGC